MNGNVEAVPRWNDEIAAIISGVIGGGRYGLKIRVPHALVMTFLFGGGKTFQEKIRTVAKLALEHSSNLAAFAGLYKLLLVTLKTACRRINQTPKLAMTVHTNNIIIDDLRQPAGQPDESYHAFIAGAVGGYVIWGRYSSLNYQLVLYLASRVFVACVQLAREKGIPSFLPWKSINNTLSNNTYPCMAAGIWGAVMMLFESYPDTLHPSLRRSMDEIYRYTGVFG